VTSIHHGKSATDQQRVALSMRSFFFIIIIIIIIKEQIKVT